MITGRIVNQADGRVLLSRAQKTTNWRDRLRGLLGRPEPGPDEGLLITPCNSIHMLFMSYPLDILFLNGRGTIISMRTSLRPWRIAGEREAKSVLELRAGQIKRLNIFCGTTLLWQ